MTDMTETEKKEVLNACKEMINIKGFIKELKLKNDFLKEKINEEITERKDEQKKMEEENRDRFNKIDKKFDIGMEKISDKINGINKFIIGGMSSILVSIIISVIMLFISRINGWF